MNYIDLDNYMLVNRLTQKELAEMIGVNVGNISKMLKGEYNISRPVSHRIKEKLGLDIPPTLEAKQRKFIHSNEFNTPAEEPHYPPSNAKILPTEGNFFEELVRPFVVPVISVKARATFDYDYYNDMPTEMYEHKTIFRSGSDVALRKPVIIEIDGDSMEKQLRSGARVLAEEVDKGNWAYTTGVVAVCFAGQFVVKRIKENFSQETGTINLHSDNPNGGGFVVKVSDIKAIWRVVEVISSKVE